MGLPSFNCPKVPTGENWVWNHIQVAISKLIQFWIHFWTGDLNKFDSGTTLVSTRGPGTWPIFIIYKVMTLVCFNFSLISFLLSPFLPFLIFSFFSRSTHLFFSVGDNEESTARTEALGEIGGVGVLEMRIWRTPALEMKWREKLTTKFCGAQVSGADDVPTFVQKEMKLLNVGSKAYAC